MMFDDQFATLLRKSYMNERLLYRQSVIDYWKVRVLIKPESEEYEVFRHLELSFSDILSERSVELVTSESKLNSLSIF